MRLPRFAFHAPESLEQLFELQASLGEQARLMAGGTDLLPGLKLGKRSCADVIWLGRIPEFDRLGFDSERGLEIGAGALLADLAAFDAVQERYPMLAAAIADLATVQVRNKATAAGNLCNASPCADTAPPLMACGARVELTSRAGTRTLPLQELMTGPGSTALRPGEVLERILVPPPAAGARSIYFKFSPRSRVDIAAVNLACTLTLADGCIDQVRIVLGTVAPTPIRAERAEALLRSARPSADLLDAAAAAAAEECRPITDFRAHADYKRHLVRVLTRRALRHCTEAGA